MVVSKRFCCLIVLFFLFVTVSCFSDVSNYEIKDDYNQSSEIEHSTSSAKVEISYSSDISAEALKNNEVESANSSSVATMELSVGFPCDKSGLNTMPDVGGRFMDVQTFAYRICATKNWSLIISCEVTENTREVKGKTIREALDQYLQNTDFRWCLSDNCLYIASKRELEDFFLMLPRMQKMLPEGNKDGTFTGNFTFIELSLLCDFLCSVSGISIKPVNDLLSSHVMMRVKDMNWKHLISAIICLNRYQVNITDYSVMIGPEPLH